MSVTHSLTDIQIQMQVLNSSAISHFKPLFFYTVIFYYFFGDVFVFYTTKNKQNYFIGFIFGYFWIFVGFFKFLNFSNWIMNPGT